MLNPSAAKYHMIALLLSHLEWGKRTGRAKVRNSWVDIKTV